MSLSIFANFQIDSLERFLRMKDSFKSFYKAKIDSWVINVRGSYKKKVSLFLKQNIKKNKLYLFTLNSEKGWFFDSKNILKYINGKYVFFWIEDHINIRDCNFFNNIITDIKKYDIDYFLYSWNHLDDTNKSFSILNCQNTKFISFTNYSSSHHSRRLEFINKEKLICTDYIVSCTGIFKKDFFLKIINTNDPFIKRWNKFTPFDFEKTNKDIHWLPYKCAFPKKEFFVSIDDDHGQDGYSLISRGLYPPRVVRNLIKKDNFYNFRKIFVVKLLLFLLFSVYFFLREFINKTYSLIKRF